MGELALAVFHMGPPRVPAAPNLFRLLRSLFLLVLYRMPMEKTLVGGTPPRQRRESSERQDAEGESSAPNCSSTLLLTHAHHRPAQL